VSILFGTSVKGVWIVRTFLFILFFFVHSVVVVLPAPKRRASWVPFAPFSSSSFSSF
jgi:hypothetical protein